MNQTTESFLRIEAIFHEALDTPGDARASLVAERCGGDVELLAEVEALLDANQAEEQITASRLVESSAEPDAIPARSRIGPYEIDRLLGRGGMGAVYLAHRADGQFDQQVAIKLIDLPLATDLFRERFRMERQILAGLQHPFIARLLDGGVTPEGDLYLAMEYVDGKPIHRFCQERRLIQSERLLLFKSVCEAVQFAHQNLVVHRDLKPDNILVAEDGTPRLLDFGTAKLVSPSLAGEGKPETDLTRQGFQSYTPQYASPEQVLGNSITTASDTYSLGVLLYLLLTESLPYELKEMTTAELLRVICHEPPRRPALSSAGKQGRLDPDLEAILLKALRKEPKERYNTAEQLSADIQCFLDGHPVEARRGTFRYRASKFIRRNRVSLAAVALILATLTAGVAGVVWQARVANEQRRKAEARSADLRQLSNSLLSELDEAIKQLPGSTGVQKLLVTRVLEHLDRMAQDAQGDRLTQLDLIDAYTRLGNIQGNAYDQNLGDAVGGLASMDKALAIARPLAASGAKDRDAMEALAITQQSRAEILFQSGRTPEAVASMQGAVQSFDTLIADPSTPVALLGEVASAYGSLGDELGQPGTPSLGDRHGAIEWYRKTIDLDNRALKMDPNFLRAKRGIVIMQLKLGTVEMETDPAQALQDLRLALEHANALPPAQQSTLPMLRLKANIVRKQANSLRELGQYAAAKPLYEQVIQLQQKLADADPQDVRARADLGIDLADEAESYEDAGNPISSERGLTSKAEQTQNLEAALVLLQRAQPLLEKMVEQDPTNPSWTPQNANVQVRIGTIETQLHPGSDSEKISVKGLATLRQFAQQKDASPAVLDQAIQAHLNVLPTSLRDTKFAVDCAERQIAMSYPRMPSRLLSLALAYHAAGALAKASATAREGLSLLPAQQPGTPKSRLVKLLEFEAQAAK